MFDPEMYRTSTEYVYQIGPSLVLTSFCGLLPLARGHLVTFSMMANNYIHAVLGKNISECPIDFKYSNQLCGFHSFRPVTDK